jgi:hypothetical protein
MIKYLSGNKYILKKIVAENEIPFLNKSMENVNE